ncbi:nuclear export factor CRM1 [Backusella circina FSU 941]|nr:nuclear export factor CRM1 [Backusella circina FSU 941]
MAEAILDFNKELDVNLFDSVVSTCLTGTGQDRLLADQLLTQFQQHEQAWTRVDGILQTSENPQTKFIALQILEKFVQTRWNTLAAESRNAIRNFIVNVIMNESSDEEKLKKQRTYLNKLNMVLVQILKQDWPRHWPSFIPEIIENSKSNLSLCENNMAILKLLSEEIFDFSSEQMVQSKITNLKQQMTSEFSEIYHLCQEILEKATKPSLIKATLQTLLRFITWVPIGFIFETGIIEKLRSRFFKETQFRNDTLKCFTEISTIQIPDKYNEVLLSMFTNVMTDINTMIPPSTNIAEVYENSTDADQELVQNLALFLTSYFTNHLQVTERYSPNKQVILHAHYYLIKISQVQDREILKICLEYWTKFVQGLFDEALTVSPMRKEMYASILSHLRVVMIESIVKPEEVLVVENDEGEIVREFVKESDTIVLYKNIKEVLVYLTNLDIYDTEDIMSRKLQAQMDGTEWSWNNLNKLCWAIGSISGAMNEETEKRFLVTVIRDLLSLCEMKRGKDNKAVVASNIMYCVGQYPRFLKAHWKFLKTVINKLFEFMHESHEGVQDMACDTFIKISKHCKRHFIVQQNGESAPFVEEILQNVGMITSDLAPQQVHTFYRAIGYMVAAQTNPQAQERLMGLFMSLPNGAWDDLINRIKQSTDLLNNPAEIKMLSNVLKTNVAACTSSGTSFSIQLSRIYMDLLWLYGGVGNLVSGSVASQGIIATKTPKVRGWRTIKKEILKLVDTFVQNTNDLSTVNSMVGPFLEAVLTDYNQNVDAAREAEVLNVISTIINRLQTHITPQIPIIFEATFQPTLNMITKDFAEYPEHRTGFYHLLRATNLNCFQALLELPPHLFKLFIDSIVWGFKHTMRDIADIGLDICGELIDNVSRTDPKISGAFYQSYYLSILQDIFFVLTDRDHKSGFKGQTEVLARLFYLVAHDRISVPLYDAAQVTTNMTNADYLREYVNNLLLNAFPHLKSFQVKVFTNALFEYNDSPSKLKLEVRDFLIQLKEFAGENAELYLEEKELELEQQKKAEREKQLRIPGMVKPSELPVMEEDEQL